MKKYHIVSLKHTNRKDKFISLWRPGNRGYCWPLDLAGIYYEGDLQKGYHHDEENVPIELGELDKYLTRDDEGRLCYELTPTLAKKLLSMTIKT